MKKKRSQFWTQSLTLLKFTRFLRESLFVMPFLSPTIPCGSHWMCNFLRSPPPKNTQWIQKIPYFGWGAALRWMSFDWIPHGVVDCPMMIRQMSLTVDKYDTIWYILMTNDDESMRIDSCATCFCLFFWLTQFAEAAISVSNAAVVWRVACRPWLSRHCGRRMVVTKRCSSMLLVDQHGNDRRC